jgi:hypothetical protein
VAAPFLKTGLQQTASKCKTIQWNFQKKGMDSGSYRRITEITA